MPITVTATTATDWPFYNYLGDIDPLSVTPQNTLTGVTTVTMINDAADPAFDRKITLTGTGLFVDSGEIWAGTINSIKITGVSGSPTYYTVTFSGGIGASTLSDAIVAFNINHANTAPLDNIFRNYQPYVFNGGAGDDFFEGSNFADTINGGAGDDVLIGFEGDDTINGGTGDDYIDGWLGSNTIDGGAGDDWIVTGTGSNTITGGAGADYLDGDHLGFDTVTFEKSATGVTVDLYSSPGLGIGSGGDAEGDTYIRVEKFIGTNAADKFIIGSYAGLSEIRGGGGNDTFLWADGTGNFTLYGGSGIDTIGVSGVWAQFSFFVDLQAGQASVSLIPAVFYISAFEFENATGGAWSDSLMGSSLANVLDGGDGVDVLAGRGGADKLIGGAGTDWAVYDESAAGVTVNLSLATAQVSAGDASGDVLIGIENLIGSAKADTLTGNAGDNTLNGGADNDILIGGKGADKLAGDVGTDTVSYATSSIGVSINLDTGAGSGGDAEGDIIYSDVENVTGSAFADNLVGSSAVNVIDGGGGNDVLWDAGSGDTLLGGAGNDTIYAYRGGTTGKGGTGNDTLIGNVRVNILFGDEGNDVIDAGAGGDFLTGGTGRDRFVYSDNYEFDQINDFQAGSKGDYLDLRGISNLTYYQQLLTPGAITQGVGYTDINLVYFNGDFGDTIRLVGVTASSLRPGNFILN